MARIIFFIILIFLGVFILRQFLLRLRGGKAREEQRPMRDQKSKPAPALMVQCSHCGLHLPATEAAYYAKRYYCLEHVPSTPHHSDR